MERSLDDLIVIEAGEGWPIALCGRLLAELGATVIKLEPPEGDAMRHGHPLHTDGVSHCFHLAAAGKRSLAIDPGSDSDRALVRRLAGTVDIVLAGHPGELPAGLEPAFSRDDAIVCYLTPFGREPPCPWRAGIDSVMQGVSGIMATTGFPDDEPYRAGSNMADSISALYAAVGILAALRHRDVTGLGQSLDIAVRDCVMTYLLLWLPRYFMTGQAPGRQGNRHLSSVPWNSYPAKDGWVMICTSTDEQWYRICDLLGRSDLGRGSRFELLPGRMREVDFIDQLVSEWTRVRTVAEAVEILEGQGTPAGAVRTIEEVLREPHGEARRVAVRVPDHAGGSVLTAGPLAKMSLTPGDVDRCAPLLDQDRTEIQVSLPRWESRPSAMPTGRTIEGALSGITVVESGVFGAGPFAGKLLAELGARVIKLEAPAGDGMRHYQPRYGNTSYPFHLYNAGKASLVVDLKSASGLAEARGLIETADVYLENLGPGVVERLGLGYADLRAFNPDIVYCSVSGYGRTGPYAKRRAYDTVIQAESGVMSLTGRPDTPTKIGISAADLIGPTFACVAILAALHYRTRRGEGQYLDVSMFDVCVWTTQPVWPAVTGQGTTVAQGNGHPLIAPYGVYPAADGAVSIGIETDAQWRAFVDLTGFADVPELARGADRIERRPSVDREIAEWTSSRGVDTVVDLCQAAGVPAGRVCSIPEVLTDGRTAEREMLVKTRDADGLPLVLTGSPFKLSRTPGCIFGRGPLLGEREPARDFPAVPLAAGDSPIIAVPADSGLPPNDIRVRQGTV